MRRKNAQALPPGPRLPRAVQALGWVKRPLPFLERCQRRYGDTFTLRMTHWGDWVVLCDPADVKTVFTAGDAVGVDVANPLLWPILGPRSVMLLEEPRHMMRRKLMLPPFHGERMQRDAEVMAEVAREEARSWKPGEPFEMWPRMQAVTQEVVVRAVFGNEEEPGLRRVRERLTRLTEWMNDSANLTKLALFGPGYVVRSDGFKQAMRPVEEAVLDEVYKRRAEGEDGREDVVSMLAHARYEDGSPMSDRELRDELLTLLTDGPTSASLARVFERLLRHPEKLARVQEEIVSGGDGSYLDAVIKETLRLCAPVPVVVRKLLEPMRLGGYDLPAGTTVAPCIHLIHRRSDVYEQPRAFMPERFLAEPPGTYTWIPFGGGTRRCLAARYAEQEMVRVLRTVLSEVDLHPVDSRPEGVGRGGIAFSPEGGAKVVAEPRAAAAQEGREQWQPIPT
ncbi:MAG TPA: cytochrome P450 [Solirubrobacterales bacterium]|nr:cytochrome P450 [Solirubrobacterales bacterium]